MNIGLSPAEFGELPPAEVRSLVRAWEDRERAREMAMDLRFGVLCSLIANRHRGKHSRPYHPADFFPSLEGLRPGPPTPEELEAKLDAAFARLGG